MANFLFDSKGRNDSEHATSEEKSDAQDAADNHIEQTRPEEVEARSWKRFWNAIWRSLIPFILLCGTFCESSEVFTWLLNTLTNHFDSQPLKASVAWENSGRPLSTIMKLACGVS